MFPIKRYCPELVIVIFTLVLFLHRGFVAGSDGASSWFSPFYNLKTLFFSWATYGGFGDYAPQNFTSFFLRAYYSIFELISPNPAVIQKLAWICFFGIFGIIFYRGIFRFTKNQVGSIAAVFFCFFNPVAQLFLWGKQHWAYYLTVPYVLGVYFYDRMATKLDIKYGFYIALLWFIFGFTFNQPAYSGSFFIIVGFLFISYFFDTKNKNGQNPYSKPQSNDFAKFIVLNIKFLCIFLLVNSVYLIPLIIGGGEKLSLAISNFAEGDRLPILREFSSINFAYSFFNIVNGTKGIFLGHTFLYFWIIFFILIFYNSLIKRCDDRIDRKKFLQLITLLIIFIFLVKGLTIPFSKLSEYIYDNRLMYIFRDFKDKFAIGYSTIISLLYILMVKHGKRFTRFYLYILCAVSLFLFVSNRWLPPAYQYSDSLSYLKESVITNKRDTTRVLNLPLVDYSFMYTHNPDYHGDNPLKNILHSDVIYGTDFKSNTETIDLRKTILAGTLTDKKLDDYLLKHHVRYILNQKNSYVKEDAEKDAYDFKILNQYKSLRLVQNHKYFQVFEFMNPSGILYTDSQVTYTKVNNSAYLIKISGITDFTTLTFLSKFDSGWNFILLKSGSYIPNCNEFYQKYADGSQECLGSTSYLNKISPDGPVPFGNSFLNLSSSAYKNIWFIERSKIVNGTPSNYWTTNPDGSISVEGVVYFEPQRVFNISLLVSLLVITTMAVYFSGRSL